MQIRFDISIKIYTMLNMNFAIIDGLTFLAMFALAVFTLFSYLQRGGLEKLWLGLVFLLSMCYFLILTLLHIDPPR